MAINAANKVFDMPELLENILLEVALIRTKENPVNETAIAEGRLGTTGHVDLFPLQRVSKTFKATMESSPVLRREMYGARTTTALESDRVHQQDANYHMGWTVAAAAGSRAQEAFGKSFHGKKEYQSWENVVFLGNDQPATHVNFLFGEWQTWVQPGSTLGDVYAAFEKKGLIGTIKRCACCHKD
ncbi:hypothetical protein HII31_07500 [Pseudocercospora fuligena]|uniref:Uncharacterized protein n=1 Tax=Pseudocercospora fuligena TaxID=685502 RepID=A0A8H6VGZ4_9PEZI|nr:hypothetical protein HII31_07500 [Pseudocercospora fuligena]